MTTEPVGPDLISLLLKTCCGEARLSLDTPFSRGEHTYATNGQIMIRVPRLEHVAERKEAPHAERVWPMTVPGYVPLKFKELPEPDLIECDSCGGRGTRHDCPSCGCECDDCHSSGYIEIKVAVSIGSREIKLKYARILMAMLAHCAVEVEAAPSKHPIKFRFPGGEGIIASLHTTHEYQICCDLLHEETPGATPAP